MFRYKKCKHVAGPKAKDDITMMMTKTAFVFTLRLLKIFMQISNRKAPLTAYSIYLWNVLNGNGK